VKRLALTGMAGVFSSCFKFKANESLKYVGLLITTGCKTRSTHYPSEWARLVRLEQTGLKEMSLVDLNGQIEVSKGVYEVASWIFDGCTSFVVFGQAVT
jgi:hypothetical protein